MLKESNVGFVYALSVIAGTETLSPARVTVLSIIFFATTLTVHGEANLTLNGFLLQMGSCLCESSKITLQGVLLTNRGKKLDALTFVLLLTPMCFVVISCVCLVLLLCQWEHVLPHWDDLVRNWQFILGSTVLAFALNVSTATFIKHSSSTSFVLAMLLKDMVVVLSGVIFFGEEVATLQVLAFGLQLVGLLAWTMLKLFPEKFENLSCMHRPVLSF